MQTTENLTEALKEGYRLGYEEAVRLAAAVPIERLCEMAGNLRRHFLGNFLDTCSIMNARSGRCSENCKWCSQSKYHHTNIEVYPLVGAPEAVALARHNAEKGVRRFSLVTSGRAMSDSEIEQCRTIYEVLRQEVNISLCASMGLLTKAQLQILYDAGVRRYHCNLETAPSYFPQLCTTHTIEEKIRTIGWAREVGMEVCSGGIIGMGETAEQRIELAVTLQQLDIRSIPINILNPIPGTALEGTKLLSDNEILSTVALFRILNPEAHIRFAGGRTLIKHLERRLLHSGISASIVGDMLTTSGSEIEQDKEMFKNEGFEI